MSHHKPLGAALAEDVVAALLANGKLPDPSVGADLAAAIAESLQRKWLSLPAQQAAAVSALLRAGRPEREPRSIPKAAETGQQPAVPIDRSVRFDSIICLEDGRELRMLKRHLRDNYDLSPEEYRRKWGLSDDYPMVAPAYVVSARFPAAD